MAELNRTVRVEKRDQVATITLLPEAPVAPGFNRHWELGSIFSDLRGDNSVRVIVLTGAGRHFSIPGPKRSMTEATKAWRRDPTRMWLTFTGLIRCHEAMAAIEKPIVAKVNGHAIGFGQSLVFASDLVVAREDAIFMDHHMLGTFEAEYDEGVLPGGVQASQVPGDGGAALVPLFMSPCKAKEYLMLAQPYTAAELAHWGVINYAVPAEELDAKVDDLVQRLLQRGAYALARTKRLVNRRIVEHLNLTLDAGAAYEMATQLQDSEIPTLG